MSYDVYLTIDTGSPEGPALVFDVNHTSNTASMWRLAGVDFHELVGMSAMDAEPILSHGVASLLAAPARFRELAPANGWGTYETALAFLIQVRDACRMHPLCRLGLYA